jgi:hypothetical protein
MLAWLRNILCCKPVEHVVRVEVNVHVKELRLFIHDSREASTKDPITESGSSASVAQGTSGFRAAPEITDQDRLEQLEGKFNNLKLPKASFGTEDK